MVLFHMSLLPGCLRIAIEDPCTANACTGEFKVVRTFEFNTVISKDYRKQSLECFGTQLIGQPVEYSFYAFLRAIFEKEYQHEVAFPEYKGQQHFS